MIAVTEDKLTKPVAGRCIHQHILGARLVVLQSSGHMGALERGNELVEAVDQFGQAVQQAN